MKKRKATIEQRVAILEQEMAKHLELRRLIVGELQAKESASHARLLVNLWLLNDEGARRPNMEPVRAGA